MDNGKKWNIQFKSPEILEKKRYIPNSDITFREKRHHRHSTCLIMKENADGDKDIQNHCLLDEFNLQALL